MKALFVLLVAANLGYFAWQYAAGGLEDAAAPAAAPPPIPEGVVELVPLDKKGQGSGAGAVHAHGGGEAAVKPASNEAGLEDTAAMGKATEDTQRPNPRAATVEADSQPAPAPAPHPRRQPPGPAASPAPAPAASSGEQAVCWLVGRFADEARARAAVEVFQGKGLDAEFSMREQQRVHYWVHTPVQPSREVANSMVTDLNTKGIRDVAVVQTGDWQNSVSLGYYSSKPIARHRLEQIQRLGVDADIQTDAQSLMTYWMRYRDAPAAEAVWQGLSAAEPKLSRERAQSCR